MDKKTGTEVLPLVTTWMYCDGIMLIDLCIADTDNRLEVVRVAPHSSALAWRIPRMEEPGGLQSMGSQSQTRLSNFTFTFHFHALEKEMATHSSVLAWRTSGMVEPGGLPSMGLHKIGHD